LTFGERAEGLASKIVLVEAQVVKFRRLANLAKHHKDQIYWERRRKNANEYLMLLIEIYDRQYGD